MNYKTYNIRTSPRCGIPGPVPEARPGDSAHMRERLVIDRDNLEKVTRTNYSISTSDYRWFRQLS